MRKSKLTPEEKALAKAEAAQEKKALKSLMELTERARRKGALVEDEDVKQNEAEGGKKE